MYISLSVYSVTCESELVVWGIDSFRVFYLIHISHNII